jgi:hypothetical protein
MSRLPRRHPAPCKLRDPEPLCPERCSLPACNQSVAAPNRPICATQRQGLKVHRVGGRRGGRAALGSSRSVIDRGNPVLLGARAWRSVPRRVRPGGLYSSEEGGVNGDVPDCARHCVNAEVILLQELAEPIAAYEINRRGAVACCFLFGICGEGPCGYQQALIAATGHGAAKVANSAGADIPAVSLALEEDREADQAEPIDAESIDAAVSAPAGDVHAGPRDARLGRAVHSGCLHGVQMPLAPDSLQLMLTAIIEFDS